MWNTAEGKQLLGHLLDELEERLQTDVPDELFAVESVNVAWPTIMHCLREAVRNDDKTRCHTIVEQVASSDTPFMLFAHQFGVLRNYLIKQAIGQCNIDEARLAMTMFEDMEEGFASIYLRVFLNRLGTRNHLRLSHIRALTDKNLFSYFESHLEWMARLVEAVSMRSQDDMPELDPTRCQFGRWLAGDGTRLIRDQSHVRQVSELHEAMHHVVAEVGSIMEHQRASGPIYALLKKAETYSLELGNEISMLNNIVIMSVYNKDPLTGFLTRRFLDRVLVNQMEIAKATEAAFSIVMFDLDHFKEVNDTYGHRTGDLALEHIAGIVRDTLRQSDLVFRFGGEEFLLVAPSTTLHQAQALAEKLRQSIAAKPLEHQPPLPLSASFGVFEISPDSYENVDTRMVHQVIDACDANLYAAKRLGRNRVV